MAIERRNATLLVQYTTAYPFKLPSNDIGCIVCCEEFRNPEEFRSHMAEEDLESSQKMLRSTPKSYAIKLDITDLSCRVCSQSFDDLDEISSHLSTEHRVTGLNLDHDLGVYPFKLYNDNNGCILCPKKFASLRALSKHTQSHYLKHTCETCGKSFGNVNVLYVHAKFAHQGSKVICRPCKTGFDSSAEKQKHLAQSRKCWMYLCMFCGERFMTEILRNKHLQSEHNTNHHYACPECSEIFTDKGARQRHFVVAHTERFKCSCCDKTFPTNYSLNNHLVMHSAEKKFECGVCSKRFGRLYYLKQHMPIHMDDKPYKCLVCNKQFNQRISLRTHMVTYHVEEEEPQNLSLKA